MPAGALRRTCDPTSLPFDSTADVPAVAPAEGQPRVIEALSLAADLRDAGFNVFATGPSGTHKRAIVEAWLSKRARAEPAPPDLVYLPSFGDRLRARAAEVPTGRAHELAADIERLVPEASERFARAFEDDRYRTEHRRLHDELDARRREIISDLDARARALGVALKVTQGGVLMMPMAAGRALTPDEVERMFPEARARYDAAVSELKEPADDAFAAVRELEREASERHAALTAEVATAAIASLFEDLARRWSDADAVLPWLEDAARDMVANVVLFRGAESERERPPAAGMSPADALRGRYAVNVIVANDPRAGAPVVVSTNPTYADLFGRIEYETTFGAVVTDHRHLRGGAVHEARGGYLLLDAGDVLTTPFAWARLKDVLRTGRIKIENPAAQYTMFPGVTPDPEPVDASIMVVLLGTRPVYEMLFALDDDVARLFKVRADFDVEMSRDDGIAVVAGLAADVARNPGTPHLDRGAIAALVDHATRLAGDQRRVTLQVSPLRDVATEAGLRTLREGRDLVTAADISAALAARQRRSNLPAQRLREAMLDGTLRLEVAGTRVGQVNGLAVTATGDHRYGHAVRITATVSGGDGQVVAIDREAELSGPLHSKGVMIVSGYLAGRYGHDGPLSVRASIVFEQSYGPVEGDSASAAELFALLSALADVPIRQGVAVTGSVDQHGTIQAIGGVNEKIEGFFALCRDRGLTGEQGVLIPSANLVHTMLDDEVVAAVRDGSFHVWTMDTVADGLAVLTDVPAAEIDERARERLERFARAASPPRRRGSA